MNKPALMSNVRGPQRDRTCRSEPMEAGTRAVGPAGKPTPFYGTAVGLGLLILHLGMTLGYAQEPDHLVLSEIMAANDQTLFDSNDEASDWIEIWNHGEAPIDLGGWFLTDTEESPKEWAFPSMTLSPGDYLVVFASGADRRAPGEELHTNFRLDREGEYLALTHFSSDSPEGMVVTSEFAPYPEQR